jgi:hypothetical protein
MDSKKVSLLDGTGGTWVQPNPDVDGWLSVEASLWGLEVILPRETIDAEWVVVAEVVES